MLLYGHNKKQTVFKATRASKKPDEKGLQKTDRCKETGSGKIIPKEIKGRRRSGRDINQGQAK